MGKTKESLFHLDDICLIFLRQGMGFASFFHLILHKFLILFVPFIDLYFLVQYQPRIAKISNWYQDDVIRCLACIWWCLCFFKEKENMHSRTIASANSRKSSLGLWCALAEDISRHIVYSITLRISNHLPLIICQKLLVFIIIITQSIFLFLHPFSPVCPWKYQYKSE